MKPIRSLFASLVVCLACVGCSQEYNEVLETPQVEKCDSLSTIEVEFEGEKPSFGDETGTRASNTGVWEDGDVVYLRLYNGGNKTNISIIYNGSTKKWSLINSPSVQTLVNAGNADCTAAYSTGVDPVTEDEAIRYSYMTAYYRGTSGKYSYNKDTKKLTITVTLRSNGWRLRFKGTSGTKIALYNLNINVRYRQCFDTTYDSETGLGVTMTVGANGYTDYLSLGTINDDCNLIVITNLSTGDTFYRSFGTSIVGSNITGKSFCYTIPTTSNLRGWSRSNVATGTANGHDYVDLGLPSGNMWATTNIGAASATKPGDYYQWAETTNESNYSWANYKYCNGSEKTLTKYCNSSSYGTVDNLMLLESSDDVATVKWGNGWMLPTEPQADEMVLNCSCYWIILQDQPGMIVIGKNGKSVFLPAVGYKERTHTTSSGELGVYLTASLYQDKPSRFKYLGLDEELMFTSRMDRANGAPARAIYAPNYHEYVDLGLPSGTLWATSNITAESPSDYGAYLAWAETSKKESYSWSNYKYGGEKTLTKYCMSSAYGTVDNKSSLDEGDDIARLLWGSGWCMPTKAQLEELANQSICSWKYESSGGGYRVTGPNGNSIFLPLAGEYVDADYKDEGVYGNYWSKSLDTNESSKAFYLFLCKRTNSEVHQVYSGPRRLGQSIRAVVAQ